MKSGNRTTADESTTLPSHPWSDPGILLAFAALILGAALGFWAGQQSMRPPAENSAEVGFARDMASHHAQAVDMAQLLYDRTNDPEMRLMAQSGPTFQAVCIQHSPFHQVGTSKVLY